MIFEIGHSLPINFLVYIAWAPRIYCFRRVPQELARVLLGEDSSLKVQHIIIF